MMTMMNRRSGRVRAIGLAVVMAAMVAAAWPGARALAEPPATEAAAPEVKPPTLPETRAGRVMHVVLKWLGFREAEVDGDWFAESFKNQVPVDQVQGLCTQLIDEHGAFALEKVNEQRGENGLVVTVRGGKTGQRLQVVLSLDMNSKIEGLLLRPAANPDVKPFKDWAEVDGSLAELPGKVSFGAYELVKPADGEGGGGKAAAWSVSPIHRLNGDERLAIGSTFKLYVLGAAAEAVLAGKLKWDDALAIKSEYKSLPSGTMQNEKEGTEFPILTYAEKMISISDNTATDHLLRRVGRREVEEYMQRLHGKPELNMPFLTTREMFALKLSFDDTLAPRWNVNGEAPRRDMLVPDDLVKPTRKVGPHHTPGEVANTNPDIGAATRWKTPRHIETIEWFASADEIARLFADLHRLEGIEGTKEVGRVLRINPGLPLDPEVWKQIAYKGGSEPGVLNLSWMLTRKDGRMFVVTLGWNDPKAAVDDSKLLDIAPRVVGVVAGVE